MNCRLFLVDIGEDRTQSEPSVRLWGVDDKDQRILIVLTKLKPYFYYVSSGDANIAALKDSISQAFPLVHLTIEDRSRLGRTVKSLKITCPDYKVMSECVKSVRKEAKSGELFEEDLRLSAKLM